MTLLCINLHSLFSHTWTSKWHHSFVWFCPYSLVTLEDSSRFFHLWNLLGCHICCKCSFNSHIVPRYMERLEQFLMSGGVDMFFFLMDSLWLVAVMFDVHPDPLGYLNLSRTSSRCFNSEVSSWKVEQAALALCVRVLLTKYLVAKLWWLSYWRYKSVCVGFLCTPVDKDLAVSGVIKVSRNGIESSGLVHSTVNWIAGSTELMWCRNSS